jgi:hypothetical protein
MNVSLNLEPLLPLNSFAGSHALDLLLLWCGRRLLGGLAVSRKVVHVVLGLSEI